MAQITQELDSIYILISTILIIVSIQPNESVVSTTLTGRVRRYVSDVMNALSQENPAASPINVVKLDLLSNVRLVGMITKYSKAFFSYHLAYTYAI